LRSNQPIKTSDGKRNWLTLFQANTLVSWRKRKLRPECIQHQQNGHAYQPTDGSSQKPLKWRKTRQLLPSKAKQSIKPTCRSSQ
jgi:hypothetical protein